MICEPYKSELYPLWKFKTPHKAQESCEKIYYKFFMYLKEDDFVGADMAKKYLHMGFTRSRRYWNHRIRSGLRKMEIGKFYLTIEKNKGSMNQV